MVAKKSSKGGSPDGKKRRVKKDPNKPKKNLSAYFYFLNDKRSEVRKRNPSADVTTIAKIVGEMWKKLSPSEKLPFEKKASADKLRYDKEMTSYKKP